MAFDLDTIEMLDGREVYFEIHEWVNKSLNFRDIGVSYDEPSNDKPDFMIRMWHAAPTLDEFMHKFFPWLDYEPVEHFEALAGEVEAHVLQVRVNRLGKSYLCVEDYFKNGPPDPSGYVIFDDEESANDKERMTST